MDFSSSGSAAELSLPGLGSAAGSRKPTEIELEVVGLFDQHRGSLLRYSLTVGLSVHDGEEVIQEVFMALFRHLQQGKSRDNLRAWMFRVTRNLALKRRLANHRSPTGADPDIARVHHQPDSSPNPEEQVLSAQRQSRLQSVVSALPEQDQSCLRLRAEGLRYREIARVMGMSLGAVSISLTRSLARLTCADAR
jgi:RNA polymerase sigma-70 factor (ECF subfamily)